MPRTRSRGASSAGSTVRSRSSGASAGSPEPKRRRTAPDQLHDSHDSRSLAKAKMGEGLEGRTHVLSDDKFKALNKALKIDKKKPQASQLKPEQVDFHITENRKAHKTDDYEVQQLIIRRGQTFDVTLTFNREYQPDNDVIILQFVTGSRPQESKGSIVRVLLSDALTPAKWGMKIKQISGNTMHLVVMPSAKALIGQYEVFVETKMTNAAGKKIVFRYKDDDTVCVLFNAWCKEDSVFMEKEIDREEYVLADFGYIWVGCARWNEGIPWQFGQFEDVALETALFLLDKAGLSPTARSSPVQIVRTISAMANYNDSDGGILFGRWTETYPKNCTPPTAWTGSTALLEKFWKKKFYVKYGQCWVFSGLVTTLLRSLGLPTRSVTNFQSAHDTDGSMTIDFHYDEEGNPLDDMDDSIWNFHVWNESWFKRPDLPDGHDGWQAHDATPQETSEGVFRCGPASVNAVKNGEVYLPYDTGFVFAEVNGDRVYWDVDDDDGSMKAGYVDTNGIGMFISTKEPGAAARLDVTDGYKYREGSAEERKAVKFAHKFSTRKEYDIYKAEREDVEFSLEVLDDVAMGDSFDVSVVVHNRSNDQRTVKVNITSVMAFYTGIPAKPLKKEIKTLDMSPRTDNRVVLKIAGKDYMGKLAGDGNIKLYVKCTVLETGQSYATQDVVELRKPKLVVTASPKTVKQNDEVEITMSFKNPLPIPLKKGQFHLEATGMSPKSVVIECQSPVAPKKEAKGTATFTAIRAGKRKRNIVVSFLSDELAGVRGECAIHMN